MNRTLTCFNFFYSQLQKILLFSTWNKFLFCTRHLKPFNTEQQHGTSSLWNFHKQLKSHLQVCIFPLNGSIRCNLNIKLNIILINCIKLLICANLILLTYFTIGSKQDPVSVNYLWLTFSLAYRIEEQKKLLWMNKLNFWS